jgi:hypothetical protein
MKFALLLSLTLSLLTSSLAEAGYYLTVCGSAASRRDVHYAQSTNPAQAQSLARQKCEAATGRACPALLCEKVFQPTKVSELPPAARSALNKRLAAIDREARSAKARAEANNETSSSLWRYIDDLKRRQREEEITKALEYFRDCQGSGGCPKR